MEEFENIYDKIKELIGDYPNRLSILEEQIDIDLQMEYFEVSRRVKENLNKEITMNDSPKLFDTDYSKEYKKDLLPRLASVEKVEAFRIIEKFMKDPPLELKNWGIMALQESKMLIESKLLDENKVFISTGLGGKGNKLRYFVVLLGKDIIEFSDLQKKVIKNEFEITLKKYNSKLEEISFCLSFATLLTMVPMNVTIKQIFKEAIDECNQYGDFLVQNFIITNVKILSFNEIKDFIEKQKTTQSGRELR
jgi:hypothetical protein